MRTTVVRALALVSLLAPSVVSAQTAEAILTRFAKTIDPNGKAASLPGFKSTGTFEVPAAGLTGQLMSWQGQPNQALMTITIPGIGDIKRGFDGTVGWSLDAMQGPRVLADKELAELAEQSDFASMVRSAGIRTAAEIVGQATVGGEACTNVKITWRSGRSTTECYSTSTGLVVESKSMQSSPMGDMEAVTRYLEWKDVEGIKMAVRMEITAAGAQQVIRLTSVEIATAPAGTFDLPAEIKGLVKR